MKIISWNCNGALRKKTKYIDALNADILVIQECEDPSQSTKAYKDWSGDYLWIGESKNKGIGIFARNGNKIERLNWSGSYNIKEFNNKSPSLSWNSDDLQSFLPCKVNNEITLLGIWTKQANSTHFGYIGQFWKYIQIHRSKLSSNNLVLCGDLNSNSIWDEPDRWWNHSDVVKELEEIGIYSLYHSNSNEEQGQETQKTFFMYRHFDKSYHIDYFFVSRDLLDKSSLEISNIRDWATYSDHVPLTLECEG